MKKSRLAAGEKFFEICFCFFFTNIDFLVFIVIIVGFCHVSMTFKVVSKNEPSCRLKMTTFFHFKKEKKKCNTMCSLQDNLRNSTNTKYFLTIFFHKLFQMVIYRIVAFTSLLHTVSRSLSIS